MDFVTSVKTCLLEKYANFEGRASRPEYWWFVLFYFGVHLVGQIIFRNWIMGLVGLALFVPSIAVGARRLHDIGKSGWLQLLGLIPVFGWAILIYWAAQPGQHGSNAWGPPTEGGAGGDTVFAPGQQ